MTADTYSAPAVDKIISDLIGAVDDAATVAKAACEREAALKGQVEQLEKKMKNAGTTEKVVLEKVAAVSREAVDDALDILINNSYIDESQREKFASALLADPNAALRLVARVATLSVPGHEEGQGLPKSASEHSPADDDADWDKCLREGA